MKRKVTFSSTSPTIHQWVDNEDRKSNWMHIVADRMRFHRRIQTTQLILEPILSEQHRQKILIERSSISYKCVQNTRLHHS